MESLTIRTAVRDDLESVDRFYRLLGDHHAELLPEVFRKVTGPQRPEDYTTTYLDSDDADYLLAELGGEIVGFVSVRRASHPDIPLFQPLDYVQISDAWVDPNHRGRGVGKTLFEAATRWAQARGLTRVRCTVWSANEAAQAFYLGLGFQPLSVDLELDREA
jgi:ribosomal protein S18 acetylase RimI-like enzyme